MKVDIKTKILFVSLLLFPCLLFAQVDYLTTMRDSTAPQLMDFEDLKADRSNIMTATPIDSAYFTKIGQYFVNIVNQLDEYQQFQYVVTTDTLDSVFANLNAGTVLMFAPGNYRFDKTYSITANRVAILGSGLSTRFTNETGTLIDTLLHVTGDSCTFENFLIQGNAGIEYGLVLDGASFGYINQVVIDSCQLNGARFWTNAKNWHLTNSHFIRNGNDGVMNYVSDNNFYDNCFFLFNGDEGIEMVQSDEVFFDNCDISSNLGDGIKISTPSGVNYGVQIKGGRVGGNYNHGIVLVQTKWTRIQDVLIKSNGLAAASTYHGINLDNADNTQITGCTFYDYKDTIQVDYTHNGINFNSSTDSCFVSNNMFPNSDHLSSNIFGITLGNANSAPLNYYASKTEIVLNSGSKMYLDGWGSDTHMSYNGAVIAFTDNNTQTFNIDSTKAEASRMFKQNQGSDVASAATITLDDGNMFDITGTADIDSIDAASNIPEESIFYLQFDGTAAVTGVVDGKNLKLAGNFAYSPDDLLVLWRRGNTFWEVTRSAN